MGFIHSQMRERASTVWCPFYCFRKGDDAMVLSQVNDCIKSLVSSNGKDRQEVEQRLFSSLIDVVKKVVLMYFRGWVNSSQLDDFVWDCSVQLFLSVSKKMQTNPDDLHLTFSYVKEYVRGYCKLWYGEEKTVNVDDMESLGYVEPSSSVDFGLDTDFLIKNFVYRSKELVEQRFSPVWADESLGNLVVLLRVFKLRSLPFAPGGVFLWIKRLLSVLDGLFVMDNDYSDVEVMRLIVLGEGSKYLSRLFLSEQKVSEALVDLPLVEPRLWYRYSLLHRYRNTGKIPDGIGLWDKKWLLRKNKEVDGLESKLKLRAVVR